VRLRRVVKEGIVRAIFIAAVMIMFELMARQKSHRDRRCYWARSSQFSDVWPMFSPISSRAGAV
jgi:cell division protein ZapA (FtsZ GTPase activity inhibitor)